MTTPDKMTPFLGTYFDRDSVLRLERWTRILGWIIFAIYLLQYVYDIGMFLYNNLANGYPLDWFYMLFNLGRPFQGLMLLAVLHILASALLILLDIEHNTRRAARQAGSSEK
jgi:ABC-type tungstate transport system substrate-binding protein